MKNIVMILWLILALDHLSYGQQTDAGSAIGGKGSIKGTVITGHNIKLAYATVKLMNDSMEQAVTICDSNGYFKLHLPNIIAGDVYLQAFYLKLSSRPYKVVHNDSIVRLVIEDAGNELSEVVVKSERASLQRKADRFIFIPEKGLLKGANTLELMKHIPFINYDDKAEDFSIINKQGTVVFINNRKSDMPKDMLLQLLRALPAGDIKNIEIITNPGSEYNANTTGGIININLRRQSYEGWLGNIAIQTVQSKYNTSMMNGSINFRKGKLAIQFLPFFNSSYNYYTTNNTLDHATKLREHLSKNRFRRYTVYGGGLNVDYDINSRNFISVKSWNSNVYGKSNTDVLTNYSTVYSMNTDSTLDSHVSGTDFYSYNFGNVNYHYNIGGQKNAYLDANFDYNYFSQRRNNDGSFRNLNTHTGTVENNWFYKNELPQKFINFSESVEFSASLKPNLKFSTGFQYSNTKVQNDLRYYNQTGTVYYLDSALSKRYDYSEKYWAAFIKFNKEISEKWSTALGLRMEATLYVTEVNKIGIRFDSLYSNLYPSLAVSFSPNPKHQFGYSLSRKITRPNIELLFPGRTYNSPNYFIENNPFLQPSLAYYSELSYLLDKKYSFALSYTAAEHKYANFVVPIVENNTTKLKETYLNYGAKKSLNLVINGSRSLFNGFWEVYLTPAFTYSRFSGTVSNQDISMENYSLNVMYDNYIYLSRKKNWTGFITFKYNGPMKDISGSVINAITALDLELKKVYKEFSFYLIASDIYNGSSMIKAKQFSNYLLSRNYSETNTYNRSVLFKVRYNFGNGQLKSNKNRNTANEEIRSRANK